MAMWDAQAVQLVTFFASTEGLRAGDIYREVIGDEADNAQSNKVPTPAAPFLSQATGRVEMGNMTVQVHTGRVDLILHVNPSPDEPVPVMSTKGAVRFLESAAEKLPYGQREIVRASMICTLARPFKTQEESSKAVLDLIGYRPKFADATDINFQINRVRQFKCAETISMNRIIRMQQFTMQFFVLEIGVPGAQGDRPASDAAFGANVVLDFNTVPGEPLEKGCLPRIYSEIADEILRVAEMPGVAALED